MNSSTAPRIAIHVQHLQGSGHLVRMLALGRALIEAGMQVRVLSGGDPTQHDSGSLDLVQLPALHCKPGDFTDLRDGNDKPITDKWRQLRLKATLAALEEYQPDLLITELFPFGRRQLRFELIPVLEHLLSCKQDNGYPIRVVCSIRDVLQRRKASREAETVGLLNKYFDAILVHGDDRYLPLSNTFQQVAAIDVPVVYTGYIHSISSDSNAVDDQAASTDQSSGVVVSAGSSAAGLPLLRTALTAKPVSQMASQPWLLRVGHSVMQQDFDALSELADESTIVERNQPGFLSTLRQHTVSVSLCGYNTSLDLLLSGRRCVLVPFEGQGESEQRDRADALSRLAHIDVLYEHELNAENLARTIDHVAVQALEEIELPDCDGLAGSVAALRQLLENAA